MPRDCTGEVKIKVIALHWLMPSKQKITIDCHFTRMYSPYMFIGIQYMNNPPQQVQPKQKGQKKKRKGIKKNKNPKSNESVRGSVSKREMVPVAMSRFRSTGAPKQINLPNGDVIVEHSEYLADVVGTAAFAAFQYPVNPGQPQTFPWLSQMAGLYESYKFDFLEFQYQNTCGSNTNGLVMLAIDYDASDPAPLDKVQLSAYQGYARDAPWKDFIHRSTKQNLNKRESYYVRTGALSANQDIKLYDTGNLFSATQGMSDPQITVGELYVKYKVRFSTPQLQNVAVGQSKSGRYTATTATSTTVAGSNAPLAVSGNSTDGVSLTALSPYSCLINTQMAVTTGSPVPSTTGSTCTIEASASVINALLSQTTAQLSFLPGQIYKIAPGANPGNMTLQVGQFNTAVL